jgi:hypothetical protein
MGLSSFRREGTTEYASHTLEGNWQEERSRLEVGEKVRLSLMEGAVVAPLDPDLSIAPPTRVPGAKSDGRLLIPDRMTRSRTTNDSSRQGADDGFREYTSMNQTFYTPVEERTQCPISIEPNFHGTWGGPVQIDGRSKTRVGPFNRSKNTQFEQGQLPDGEEKVAKKLISLDTFHYALDERPTAGPTNGGFGSILPRHLPSHSERMLETTAMASWR